jgi:hypothetical protein
MRGGDIGLTAIVVALALLALLIPSLAVKLVVLAAIGAGLIVAVLIR